MALATPMPVLNEADYQKYRVPSELGCFGALQTSAGYLPLQELQLQGHIVGLFTHLRLRQRFYNAYSQPLEATYIFPLPGRSAVSSFVMTTQQRRVVGRLEERGEARRQYQQAIAQGKQAALAEEERSEVFTLTVGNIPAHEWVDVELELDGPLSWSDGEAMFRFPLVVAPRYIPGLPYRDSVGTGTHSDTDAVPDASRISPPVLLPGYPNPVRLSLEISVHPAGLHFGLPQVSLADLMCWQESGGFRLALQPTCNRLDRDLIVRFPLPSPNLQSSFQVQSHAPDLHYFGLNLVPDDRHQRGYQTPRQVVALLDRSGSMSGWKMVCARRAVGRLIDSFCDIDSFQVLTFDDRVEALNPSRPGLRPAVDRERYLALEQLGKVSERGGTEILRAIEAGVRALRGQVDPYLVLITDGQVGNESEVLRWVQQNAAGIRLFTIGIDQAVNVSLLQRLADVTGGHFTLVENEEQLDKAMSGLRKRINPPLLSSVRVLLPGSETSPAEVDLYAGLCSRLLGVCRGPLPAEVEVVGVQANGHALRTRLPVQIASGVSLEKIWARERVLELEHGFLAGWRQPHYQPAAIASFALQHGVLCRFTAFVAVDENSYVTGPLHQVTQAVSQPAGWAQSAPAPARSMVAKHRSPLGASGISAKSGMLKSTWLPASPAPASADAFAAGADPFAAPVPEADPFGLPAPGPCAASAPPLSSPPANPAAFEPFGAVSFSRTEPKASLRPPARPGRDEVQQALQELRGAATLWELDGALRQLREALLRRGYSLDQLRLLDDFIRHLATRNALDRYEVSNYARQCDDWVAALLGGLSVRQESFWLA